MMDENKKNSEKMEMLGCMTRGLVHDFNNSLASILGYSEFLVTDLDPKSEHYVFASNIQKAGFQLQMMIDQIRALSAERNTGRDVSLNVTHECRNLSERLQSYLLSGQTIEFVTDIEIAMLTLPTHQLNTLINNLVKNAIESLGQGTGQVTIKISDVNDSTSEIFYDLKSELIPHPKITSPCLCISITDTGCGMNDVVLNLSPSAHFTTKSQDEATGLGLMVAIGIVGYLSGGISISTTESQGTNVTITLPVESIIKTIDKPLQNTNPKSILLVEDRDSVRHTILTMLVRAGHTVEAVENGLLALDILRESPTKFDLVITDFMMQGINGNELISEIRNDFETLPIILMSGDTGHLSDSLNDYSNLYVLPKPITSQNLRNTLSSMSLRK